MHDSFQKLLQTSNMLDTVFDTSLELAAATFLISPKLQTVFQSQINKVYRQAVCTPM